MWLLHSGIPPLFHTARHTPTDESLLGKSVYLYGPAGCGKTHMMIATMMREYFSGETDSLFITMNDLLEQIRRSYNTPSAEDPIAKFLSVKHLYIDDMGVEKVTDWVIQTVDRLINHRYNWMMRTTISSNFTLQELADRFEVRIASRIVGMCSLVEMNGRDRRLPK